MRINESYALKPRQKIVSVSLTILTAVLLLVVAFGTSAAQTTIDPDAAFLPSPVRVVSTVPKNGDQNPYGVAFVPNNFQTGTGALAHGDILVSNWNNSSNLQGTGTTIVRVPPTGNPSTFFQGKAGLGLTTALGILQYGFVLVGNSPTTDGTDATTKPGSLLVINNKGQLLQTFTSSSIQGPWDMALVDKGDQAYVFLSNAFTGAIVRLNFTVTPAKLTLVSTQTIASGYFVSGNPATVFIAPTGLAYDPAHNMLYVASTGDNAVFAIANATTRTTDAGMGEIVYQDDLHLHGALGLAISPNGHLLVTNNDAVNPSSSQPSEIVEFTTDGSFVKEMPVDPGQGGAFGLAVSVNGSQATFAAVDDVNNTLIIWTLNL
jgi:DNA-binding beta-propeller fold protein YncE